MQRTTNILSSLAFLAVIASVTGATLGCSSTSATDGGMTSALADPSFKTDIMPIFHQSCTLSAYCHGQPNDATALNLYLGNNFAEGDNTAMTTAMAHAAIVGVTSIEDPLMKIVKPGDKDNSYLIHKLNGDQNSTTSISNECAMKLCNNVDCTTATPCGNIMPQTGQAIDPVAIQNVTNWVTMGAKNN